MWAPQLFFLKKKSFWKLLQCKFYWGGREKVFTHVKTSDIGVNRLKINETFCNSWNACDVGCKDKPIN